MSHDDKKDAADFFFKLAETQGVSVSTVSDGHVLLFKRSHMQSIIDQHPDKEMLAIFVKRTDASSAN